MQATAALARAQEAEGTCGVAYIDERRVAAVRAVMPSDAALMRATDVFGALGSRTRLLVVFALVRQAELCVCDLAAITGRSVAGTSHQLHNLRQLGLVTFRMEGKLAYYRLTSDVVRDLVCRLVQPMTRRKGTVR